MKKTLTWFLGAVLLALLVAGGVWYYHYRYPLRNVVAGDFTINGTTIVVEVANDPVLRATGLSGREYLDPKAGMIFVFGKPDFYQFWMKDMKFPIDLIWLDKDWQVVDIKKYFLPDSYPATATSKTKALYVVEVNAGFTKDHGIEIGQRATFEPH